MLKTDSQLRTEIRWRTGAYAKIFGDHILQSLEMFRAELEIIAADPDAFDRVSEGESYTRVCLMLQASGEFFAELGQYLYPLPLPQPSANGGKASEGEAKAGSG